MGITVSNCDLQPIKIEQVTRSGTHPDKTKRGAQSNHCISEAIKVFLFALIFDSLTFLQEMKLRSLHYYHNETEHQQANSIIVNTMNLSNQVTTALAYPFPTLTKITGKPTAATLSTLLVPIRLLNWTRK